jgi:FkbM family methyltransferase
MSITSYAQNFEDVMLWRALGHIEHGFYIDIGAQDPIIDSVSLAFHEHGWRGIHVEPTPHYAELLRQQRPGDKVIQAAVGKGPAKLPFFEIPDTGLSTADPVIAEQHRERGFDVHEISVPCIPLSAVFKMWAGSEIHWLKIDVEGFEKQVLSSWGKSAARPWIVVVESTLPLTQIETHESWEVILIAYGYTSTYFDGLNRYYVLDAHPELRDAFRTPPNVFDGFTLNGTASTPFHHLIKERYEKKIGETVAQIEQQKQISKTEIGQFAKQLDEECKRSEWLNNEWNAAKKIEGELRAHVTLEHQEIDQLSEKITSYERELVTQIQVQRQYAEREQALSQQLQAGQEELRHLEQKQAKREQEFREQTNLARQELETLLRTLAQREQQVAAQLMALQQKAEQEKAEQARSHSEQVRMLRNQHAEREQSLSQQLQASQLELRSLEQDRVKREQVLTEQTSQARQQLETLLRTLAQREQEVAAQLLTIQQQAELKNAEQARSHSEQERAQQSQYAEREQALTRQLQAGQQELHRLEKVWAKREQELNSEVAKLQSEIQARHHAQQLQAQQHDYELTTKQEELHRLIQTYTALETQLNAQIQIEQQNSYQLRQALAEVLQHLALTQGWRIWRNAPPMRQLVVLIRPQNKLGPASPVVGVAEPTSPMVPTVSESQPINVQPVSRESNMHSSTLTTDPNTLTVATTVDELLSRHDSAFVSSAYQALLGRNADPEGMKYYLQRLRTGIARIQIVAQLYLSTEGKARAVKLAGLDAAIKRYQWSQNPLVGWMVKRFGGVEGNTSIERELRSIENQLYLLGEESDQRISQMEKSLATFRHLVMHLTQPSATALFSTPQTSVDVANASPPQTPEPDELKHLSTRARNIYFQLKAAVACHTGRTA